MAGDSNIFACLVHENQECVIDLVRNLHALDPHSLILLYNGGQDGRLLDSRFPFQRYGAVVHPRPRPQAWGRLHDFALDCMQFALEHYPFRTMTIVDSDQLAMRHGYASHLAAFLDGDGQIGMLGSSPARLPPATQVGPAQAAYREFDLWRPFLRSFPQGESKFVHWSFWPSTVFTAGAAKELRRLVVSDRTLQEVMSRTRIWATEEVILPTLVALLGYKIAANPCSYDYVKYRANYTLEQIRAAQSRPDVFWVHPVPRRYNDALRQYIRSNFGHYEDGLKAGGPMSVADTRPETGLLLTWPIFARMKQIEGWLAEDEADLLIAATALALTRLPQPHSLVEVGSYCGRSTVVIGSVVKALGPDARLYAIDPHDGKVGALDQGIVVTQPTLEKLKRNLAGAGLADLVSVLPTHSWEVAWAKPISLIFIDGLHDYANVARDFHHFEKWLTPGAYIAFHDYADYYPGVKVFVHELLKSGQYQRISCVGTLMVLRKTSPRESSGVEDAQPACRGVADQAMRNSNPEIEESPRLAARDAEGSRAEAGQGARASVITSGPRVSCLMPTADRRVFVPQAIKYFQRQDYPNRELLILDDGSDSVADLVPPDPRIRYVRLAERRTIGAKHNVACEMAQGEIMVHWDDDDWMADRRLSHQVRELLQQPPMTLCGLAQLFFYEPRTDRSWEYVYAAAGRAWVSGATFCYRRQFWQRHPFPSINEGGDTAFVYGLRDAKVYAHADHNFYVAMVHSKNTSPKRTSDSRWHPCPTESLPALLRADMSFYAGIHF